MEGPLTCCIIAGEFSIVEYETMPYLAWILRIWEDEDAMFVYIKSIIVKTL